MTSHLNGIDLNGLDQSPGMEDSDIAHTQKGNSDYKEDWGNIAEWILEKLSPQDISDLLEQLGGSLVPTLNANTLEGATRQFLQNANNLNAGTVPNARLPTGSNYKIEQEGSLIGDYKHSIVIPQFLTGERLIIKWGRTLFHAADTTFTIGFPGAFPRGFGQEDLPFIIVSPFCRSNSYDGSAVGNLPARQLAEVDARPWYCDKNQIRCSAVRTHGSGFDMVAAHWLAIGRF